MRCSILGFDRTPAEPGCVVLSFAEDDRDVAETLLDTRGSAHCAWPPTTHVLVGSLVDERRLDEQAIDVDPRGLRLRVRHGALDELLDDRRGGLSRELEELQRLAGLTPADEIH